MKSAMDAVKKGQLSVLRATVQYDVPRSTLHDRISGRVVHGTNGPGAKPYLNKAEEKEFSEFIVTVALVKQIKIIAEKVATEKEVLR